MLEGLRVAVDARADLVMAADAFVYVPDLAPIIAEAVRVLQPQGLLAFTVEAHSGDGIVLGRSLRYAHSATYLRTTLEDAKLTVCAITPTSTRTEAGEAVPGFVVTAIKS
jgi:predicted TPR repeat methyltransferase